MKRPNQNVHNIVCTHTGVREANDTNTKDWTDAQGTFDHLLKANKPQTLN